MYYILHDHCTLNSQLIMPVEVYDYRTPGNLVDCVELGYCIYCKEQVNDMCLNKICRQKERDSKLCVT
jgi:hypothetical protein